MKNKYLLSFIISIGCTLLQGTTDSAKIQINFKLHRSFSYSQRADETPYRIALNEPEITEIKRGNTACLEQKLNALDVRKEQNRYDYFLEDGVRFEGDKLIVASLPRLESTFRPIEIIRGGELTSSPWGRVPNKLKIQIADPRIGIEAYCFVFVSNSEIPFNEFFYTLQQLYTLCNFAYYPDDLIICENQPISLDGTKIGIFDWFGHGYRIELSSLVNTLLFAQDLAKKMKITAPDAFNLLCSYYGSNSANVISRKPGTENVYHFDLVKICEDSETHNYCSALQVRVKFTTDGESPDWYKQIGCGTKGLENIPQNGFINSVIVAGIEFPSTRKTLLNKKWLVRILGPLFRNLGVSEILEKAKSSNFSISPYPIEEIYKRIDFDMWSSVLSAYT